jgi:hypothetical protein
VGWLCGSRHETGGLAEQETASDGYTETNRQRGLSAEARAQRGGAETWRLAHQFWYTAPNLPYCAITLGRAGAIAVFCGAEHGVATR